MQAMPLTEDHLETLSDSELRTLALRMLDDVVIAFNNDLANYPPDTYPNLDPSPFHNGATAMHEYLARHDLTDTTPPPHSDDRGLQEGLYYDVEELCIQIDWLLGLEDISDQPLYIATASSAPLTRGTE